MDVEKFVRHLCRLVLRHQMPVWNYFVNSFYSAASSDTEESEGRHKKQCRLKYFYVCLFQRCIDDLPYISWSSLFYGCEGGGAGITDWWIEENLIWADVSFLERIVCLL